MSERPLFPESVTNHVDEYKALQNQVVNLYALYASELIQQGEVEQILEETAPPVMVETKKPNQQPTLGSSCGARSTV